MAQNDHPTLTLAQLANAVGGGAVAIRARARLQPAGGPGDKIFPPTYATGDRADTRYAFEDRVVEGEDGPQTVRTVLLDSVQSQANRMEEALREAWQDGEASFPVIAVDFSAEADIEDLGLLTTLDAPHRIADALMRDSVDADGKPFRHTAIGRAYTDARVTHATAVYSACPTALVFGVWDSTGPKGGMGAKFARALVSEIVGFNAQDGVKTKSRIDPAAIGAIPIFEDKDDPTEWTADEAQAAKDKNKPKPFSRGGDGSDKGKASAANHSNVAPSIDTVSGGVTIAHAEQTMVLSLAALRRLRFSTTVDGAPVDPAQRRATEQAARTALAALGLAAVVLQREQGHDLRSRCLLIPDGPLSFDLIPRDGGAPTSFRLDRQAALDLLQAAGAAAAGMGMGWQRAPLTLRPAPKLSALIRKSRELALPEEG